MPSDDFCCVYTFLKMEFRERDVNLFIRPRASDVVYVVIVSKSHSEQLNIC